MHQNQAAQEEQDGGNVSQGTRIESDQMTKRGQGHAKHREREHQACRERYGPPAALGKCPTQHQGKHRKDTWIDRRQQPGDEREEKTGHVPGSMTGDPPWAAATWANAASTWARIIPPLVTPIERESSFSPWNMRIVD